MKTLLVAAALLMALPAAAAEERQPGGTPPAMDLSKMGSAGRKPKDEKAVKREIDAFLKEEIELEKRGDFEAMLPRLDFPLFMVTDDSKGVVTSRSYSQQEYVAEMKPWYEQMPKELRMTHKFTVRVLSEALATVEDEHTTVLGKQKVSGRSEALLIKRDGKWKWKSMVEAGWGEMAQPPAGDSR